MAFRLGRVVLPEPAVSRALIARSGMSLPGTSLRLPDAFHMRLATDAGASGDVPQPASDHLNEGVSETCSLPRDGVLG